MEVALGDRTGSLEKMKCERDELVIQLELLKASSTELQAQLDMSARTSREQLQRLEAQVPASSNLISSF